MLSCFWHFSLWQQGTFLETLMHISKQASLILVGVGFIQTLLVGVRHDSTENKQIFQQHKCLSQFLFVFLGQRPGLWAQSMAESWSPSWVLVSPACALLPLLGGFAQCGAEHSQHHAWAIDAACMAQICHARASAGELLFLVCETLCIGICCDGNQ